MQTWTERIFIEDDHGQTITIERAKTGIAEPNSSDWSDGCHRLAFQVAQLVWGYPPSLIHNTREFRD